MSDGWNAIEKKQIGSGSGSTDAWSVEARYASHGPRVIAGMLLDNRWQRVQFDPSPTGVPSKAGSVSNPSAYGHLDYAAAQALRWWFVAQADVDLGSFCLETRLVQYRINYSYQVEQVSAHAYVGGEDRSNIMPDWGAKPQPVPTPPEPSP